jgi:hypothetical protein
MDPADARPVAFRWLELVLSKHGPASPKTKLVLAAVFQRIDWDTGAGFFESSRSLAERLGLSKSTAAWALRSACDVGPFLKRKERACGKEPWRRGFTYSLAFPDGALSPCTDRREKDCPSTGTEEAPVSKIEGGPVQNQAQPCPAGGTYSPLNPHLNPQSAPAPAPSARAARDLETDPVSRTAAERITARIRARAAGGAA